VEGTEPVAGAKQTKGAAHGLVFDGVGGGNDVPFLEGGFMRYKTKARPTWLVSAFWREKRKSKAWELPAPPGIRDAAIAIEWARHDKPSWVPDNASWRAKRIK